MPPKHEHVLTCNLSKRQRQLYDEYMGRSETRAVMSGGNFMGVINVLMQLRKVGGGGVCTCVCLGGGVVCAVLSVRWLGARCNVSGHVWLQLHGGDQRADAGAQGQWW